LSRALDRAPWHRELYEERRRCAEALGAVEEAGSDARCVESFGPWRGEALESRRIQLEGRVDAAIQRFDRKALWRLSWEAPGRAATLFDYARVLGMDSLTPEELGLCLLAQAAAVYRLPRLESLMVENCNQMMSFAKTRFLSSVKLAARREPRLAVELPFVLGSLSLFQWLRSQGREGSLEEVITRMDACLDGRPDHRIARFYRGFAIGLSGSVRLAESELRADPKAPDIGADARRFYLGVLRGARGDLDGALLELRRCRAQQRLSVLRDIFELFPPEARRSKSLRRLAGR
jgi:hypothetical protein